MSELSCGRYFVLEGEIDGLFGWIEEHTDRDWAVYFYGMCPVKDLPILSAVFESAAELQKFETVFLNNQVNQSLIYTGRRAEKFEWPSSEERRGNPERRRLIMRRQDGREGGRRLLDSSIAGQRSSQSSEQAPDAEPGPGLMTSVQPA